MAAYANARPFAQVQELAVADELTGVANRRHFFEVADRDLAVAAQNNRPAVTMMIDIDHFERVNDTYGHPTGDDVIRVVAERLFGGIRGTDLVGRYGGEEFAILLPDTDVGVELPVADHGVQRWVRPDRNVAGGVDNWSYRMSILPTIV